MDGPISELNNEHGGILLMLKILEKAAGKLEAGEGVENGHLEKITEFLTNFADKCHHGKEEGILFPVLVGQQADLKGVNELLGEHMSGRDYLKGMREALPQLQPGNPHAHHLAINARGYISLLREHIKKESEGVFIFATTHLSPQQQVDMLTKFEKLETEVIGEGAHEKYHGWLEELNNHYLADTGL